MAQNAVAGFEFKSWPSRVTAGVPFPVQIRAVQTGFGPTITNSPLTFAARLLGNGPVILSEANRDFVELTATGSEAVDVSGWQIQILSADGASAGRWLKLPAGTLLPAGGVLTWSSKPVEGGLFFPSDKLFESWDARVGAIVLRNSQSEVVDAIPFARIPENSPWTGPLLTLSWNDDISESRAGSPQPGFSDAWSSVGATPGRPNPGLILPWPDKSSPVPLEPQKIQLSEGVWNGSMTLHQSGLVRVSAFDPSGSGIESPDIRVDPPTGLTFVATPASLSRTEAHSGIIPGIEVVLSKVLPSDLRLTLTSSDPGEIAGPAELVLPAGQLRVAVLVHPPSIPGSIGSSRSLLEPPFFESHCRCPMTRRTTPQWMWPSVPKRSKASAPVNGYCYRMTR